MSTVLNLREHRRCCCPESERIKRKIYGDYVTEYNSVGDIARMFLSDSFKGINAFDYIEKYNTVTKEYAEQILSTVFDENNMVLSVVKSK